MVKPDAKALRRVFEQRGITVTRFARQIHRHPQSIWNILSGDKTTASEVFMRQIAGALEVGIEEITRQPGDDADAGEKDDRAAA